MKNGCGVGCMALGLLTVTTGGCDRLEDILHDVGQGDCDHPGVQKPRLMSPLSGLVSFSQRPALQWTGYVGSVQVDVCQNRACQQPLASLSATGGTGVGDVNGYGYSDDLAQVSSLVGSMDAERVYFGSPVSCAAQDCLPHPPLLVPGHLNDGDGYAAILGGGAGDLNGDGYDDIVYGEPGAGSVYIFYGSAAGPAPMPSLTLTFAQGFGFSVRAALIPSRSGNGGKGRPRSWPALSSCRLRSRFWVVDLESERGKT
jgi:hypothetical protein